MTILAYKDTSRAFARHSFSLSFDPQEMSLNIDINMILPVKFSGVSSDLNSNRLTSSLSCNVLNPGKYSTRSPSAHRRFCQSFCIPEKFRTIPTIFSNPEISSCSDNNLVDMSNICFECEICCICGGMTIVQVILSHEDR